MSIRFSDKQVFDALIRTLADKGMKYVDNSDGLYGTYFDKDGNPSCLLGYIFFYLGVDVPDGYNTKPFNLLPWYIRLRFTKTSRQVLIVAQVLQDYQEEWGDIAYNIVEDDSDAIDILDNLWDKQKSDVNDN